MDQSSRSALTLLAFACIATAAHADTSADASFSDFTITLIDMNPDDGITPWISFGGSSNANTVTSEGGTHAQAGATAFQAVTAHTTSPDADAVASYAGDPLGGGGLALASAHARTWSSAGATMTVANDTFLISPGTEMIITADATVTATAQGRESEYGHAIAYLQVNGTTLGGFQQNGAQLGAAAGFEDGPWCCSGQYASQAGPLQASFLNMSGVEASGQFAAWASAIAFAAPVVSVPEPAGAALWLAGLGLLGLSSMRRLRDVRMSKSSTRAARPR